MSQDTYNLLILIGVIVIIVLLLVGYIGPRRR